MTLLDAALHCLENPSYFAEIDGDRMTLSLGFIDEDMPPAERRRRRIVETLSIDD